MDDSLVRYHNPMGKLPARGSYLRWLFFGAGCLAPAIIDRMFEAYLARMRERPAHKRMVAQNENFSKQLKPGG